MEKGITAMNPLLLLSVSSIILKKLYTFIILKLFKIKYIYTKEVLIFGFSNI